MDKYIAELLQQFADQKEIIDPSTIDVNVVTDTAKLSAGTYRHEQNLRKHAEHRAIVARNQRRYRRWNSSDEYHCTDTLGGVDTSNKESTMRQTNRTSFDEELTFQRAVKLLQASTPIPSKSSSTKLRKGCTRRSSLTAVRVRDLNYDYKNKSASETSLDSSVLLSLQKHNDQAPMRPKRTQQRRNTVNIDDRIAISIAASVVSDKPMRQPQRAISRMKDKLRT